MSLSVVYFAPPESGKPPDSLLQLLNGNHGLETLVYPGTEAQGVQIGVEALDGQIDQWQQQDKNIAIVFIHTCWPTPLRLARKLHERLPEAHLIFIGDDKNPELEAQLQSPVSRLGTHWSLLPLGSPGFEQRVTELVNTVVRRNKFRTTLTSVNSRLVSASKPDIAVLQRYTVSIPFLNKIIEHTHDAIIATSLDGTVVKWNLAAAKLFGIDEENALGRSILKMFSGDARHKLRKYFDAIQQGGSEFVEYELCVRNSTGRKIYFDTLLSAIKDPAGQVIGVSAIVRDVTERKLTEQVLSQMRRDLERMSYEDGLTGVANRRMFDMTLAKEWRRALRSGRAVSLIMVDVDYFKAFNDRYGHQEGDECLKKVANTLKQVIGRSSDLVARYGGEEFAILLPETELLESRRLAERCRDKVRAMAIPHELSDAASVVTISLGISSVVPGLNAAETDLLNSADAMLYQAKELGRDQVAGPHCSIGD